NLCTDTNAVVLFDAALPEQAVLAEHVVGVILVLLEIETHADVGTVSIISVLSRSDRGGRMEPGVRYTDGRLQLGHELPACCELGVAPALSFTIFEVIQRYAS